jgi:Fe-S cluster assembly ATPase SufC
MKTLCALLLASVVWLWADRIRLRVELEKAEQQRPVAINLDATGAGADFAGLRVVTCSIRTLSDNALGLFYVIEEGTTTSTPQETER